MSDSKSSQVTRVTGQRRRVAIHARYSTDEQKASSIDAWEKLAWPARERRDRGLSAERIAEELGTTRKTVYEAVKLAEMMEQRQIREPYCELKSAPATASRWKSSGPSRSEVEQVAE